MNEGDIQGYLPAIRNRGKLKFVRFGGGFTKEYLHAVVVDTVADALDMARCAALSLWDVPEACALDGNCELVEATK